MHCGAARASSRPLGQRRRAGTLAPLTEEARQGVDGHRPRCICSMVSAAAALPPSHFHSIIVSADILPRSRTGNLRPAAAPATEDWHHAQLPQPAKPGAFRAFGHELLQTSRLALERGGLLSNNRLDEVSYERAKVGSAVAVDSQPLMRPGTCVSKPDGRGKLEVLNLT